MSSNALCSLEEAVVRTSNVASSVLHVVLAAATELRLANQPATENAPALAYLAARHSRCALKTTKAACASGQVSCVWVPGAGCADNCAALTTQAACAAPACAWSGTACALPDYMLFQQFPLEAGFATALTAAANVVLFWPAWAQLQGDLTALAGFQDILGGTMNTAVPNDALAYTMVMVSWGRKGGLRPP